MIGLIMRKLAVAGRIGQLPEKEKERACQLYKVLDRVEWLTVAPFYFGIYVLLAVVSVMLLLKIEPPGGEVANVFYGLGVVLCWIISVIGLKKIYFNPHRKRVIDDLRTMLMSDHNFTNTLETLKRLDPDMARNIRKFIP